MDWSWLSEMRNRLPRLRAAQAAQARVGVFLGADYVALAATSSDGDRLLACDYRDLGRKGWAEALQGLVEAHGLGGSPASIVLNGDDYEIQQMEIPGVPDAELAEALRYRLKDMISIPLTEAAVAGHRQRTERHRSRAGLTLAIIARRRRVEQLVASVEAADLVPEEVISRETAMHDLAVQVPGIDDGLALVLIGDGAGAVTVSRGRDLYLARGHNVSLGAIRHDEALAVEQLASEVQRTTDYYDSQLSSQPLSQIRILPGEVDLSALTESLNELLRVPASKLGITQILEAPADIPLDARTEARCALAVAATMPRSSGEAASLYHRPSDVFRWDAPAVIGGGVAAGILVLGVVSLVHGWYLGRAEQSLAEVEAERDGLLEEVGELEAELEARKPPEGLQDRRQELASELETARAFEQQIADLEVQALDGFSSPLGALGESELEPVWLSRLQLGMQQGGFEGFALQAQDVMRFVDYLAERPLFHGMRFTELDIERMEVTADDITINGQAVDLDFGADEAFSLYQFTLTTAGMEGLGEPGEAAEAEPGGDVSGILNDESGADDPGADEGQAR